MRTPEDTTAKMLQKGTEETIMFINYLILFLLLVILWILWFNLL